MGAKVSKGNIEIYNKCGYTGTSVRLPLGDYTTYKLNTFGINSTGIQSLTIGPHTVVELYVGDNFSGKMIRAINDMSDGSKGVACLQDTNLGTPGSSLVTNSVTIGSLKITDYQSWKKSYKPPQIVNTEDTATQKGSNVLVDSTSGNEILDLKPDADGTMNLEGVNNKKVVVKDLKVPLKIRNVNGLCVIKEMINNNKENLTVRDVHHMAEKCINSVEVNPIVCPLIKDVKINEKKPIIKSEEKKPIIKSEEKKPIIKSEEKKPIIKSEEEEKKEGFGNVESSKVYNDNLMWVLCVTLIVLIIIWFYMMNYNK